MPENDQNQEQMQQIADSLKKIFSSIFGLTKSEEKQSKDIDETRYELNSKIGKTKNIVEKVANKLEVVSSITGESSEMQTELLNSFNEKLDKDADQQEKHGDELKSVKLELKNNNKTLKQIKLALEDMGGGDSGGKGDGLFGKIGSLLEGGKDALRKGLSTLASGAMTFAPLLARVALPAMGILAAAAGGYMIGKSLYDNWVGPWMDDKQKALEQGMAQKRETDNNVILNDKGEAMYMVDNQGKTEALSESELQNRIKSTKDPVEKQELEKGLMGGPMKAIVDKTTGQRVDAFTQYVSGESSEMFRERLTADEQSRSTPEGRVAKQAEIIAEFDERARKQVEQRIGVDAPNASDYNDGLAKSIGAEAIQLRKYILSSTTGFSDQQKQDLLSLSPLLNNPILPKEDSSKWDWTDVVFTIGGYSKEGMDRTKNPKLEEIKERLRKRRERSKDTLKKEDIVKPEQKEKSENVSPATPTAMTPSSTVADQTSSVTPVESEKLTASVTPVEATPVTPATNNAEIYAQKYVQRKDKFSGEILGYLDKTTGKFISSVDYEEGFAEAAQKDNTPKAKSEAVISGTKSGTTVTLGEDYTPEAIISAKPNQITKDIASNIVQEITASERMSLLLQDGLHNSKSEYFDMTKAQPLASSGSGAVNVVTNVMGGSGNQSEPNSQYNPSMLNLTQPETVAQQCLYDFNKAALL
jgi:hypothetical protein